MLKNRSIVCIALTTWESDFMNTLVQMMSILSKDNKILFVDYQHTVKDVLTTYIGNKKAPVKRMFALENPLRAIKTKYGSEVHVLTLPPVLPVNWIKNEGLYRKFLNINAGIVEGTIQKAIKQLEMEDPIMVNGYNSFLGLPLAGKFCEKLNVYYCYDEVKGDQWYHYHGPKVEADFIKKSDMVITTSEALHRSKSPMHKKCYVVKNGVDFDAFNKVAEINKFKEDGRRTIGYTGSVDERFDIHTMEFVISKLPNIEFQFIGRVTNENARKKLTAFPNVKFLPSRKADQIPLAVAEFDLGIIPYVKNEVTSGVYPLKINEYLAVGKPVVMTDFADLQEFKSIVSVAKTKEEFLSFINEELYTDNLQKRQVRVDFARKNSWDNRVKQFSEIVEKALNEKRVVYNEAAYPKTVCQ